MGYPLCVIFLDLRGGLLGRGVKPSARAGVQIGPQPKRVYRACCVNCPDIEAHAFQEPFSKRCGTVAQLYFSRIGGDATKDEAVRHAQERVGRAETTVGERREARGCGGCAVRPIPARRDQRLSLPNDVASTPAGDDRIPWPAEAPAAFHARCEAD